MDSTRDPPLPTEILLIIAKYLEPLDQVALVQVFPGITHLFNFHQFACLDENGDTILHHLARGNPATKDFTSPNLYITFLQSLLYSSAEGAILHPQNLRGETPLMEAAYVGNIPAIQLLLEKDPDGLNIVDWNGATVLWYAVYGGKAPAIALLLEQPSVNVNHQVKANVRKYNVVSLLIKHPKTDLTFPDHYTGETAIHLAIDKGREHLIRDMVECGRLDVNAACLGGWTALHTAAGCRDVAMVKLLLAQDGINVNCQSSSGETPLMRTKSPRCLKILLAHPDIEVDLVDDFGWSGLGYAAERGDRGCAWVLLQHGARPDLEDLDGYTAKGRAEQAKQWDGVKFLESGCKPKPLSPSNSAMELLDLSSFWAMVDALH